jgi:DNA replication protein DnaC
MLARDLKTWHDKLFTDRQGADRPEEGLNRAAVLVLDNLGQGSGTVKALTDELQRVIEERHNARAITILTTEYDATELARVLGQASASRLLDRQLSLVLPTSGLGDWRQKKEQ